MKDEEKIQYLQKSYSAVDGLWFMMVEEAFGFETALELDKKVWEVMPKIQSRFIKSISDTTDELTALKEAFVTKLEMEGCSVESADTPEGFEVLLHTCPWRETMVRSGREHLSPRIGDTVCPAEFSGWGKAFGEAVKVSIHSRICHGDGSCRICFQD